MARTYRGNLTEDLESMEEAMCRLGNRCDIWKDRLLWHVCKAVFDILQYLLKEGRDRDRE